MIELCVNEPLRVAAYARISTEEEIAEEGSFENQKLFFENEIKSHSDWTLAKVYGDYAKSGTQIAGREEFQQMISDAQNHAFDYILTKSISRFARNTADCVESVRKLKAAGVNIYFMDIDGACFNSRNGSREYKRKYPADTSKYECTRHSGNSCEIRI